MTKFIMENTKLPTFDPLPKYIWHMDLSDTDKLVYVALLGRTTLSQRISGLIKKDIYSLHLKWQSWQGTLESRNLQCSSLLEVWRITI